LNPSGLLVYQVGSATLINGQPIPEVAAWLPLLGALALYGVSARRRSQRATALSV
jgi:lipopolysaccharide export LptBFGC system permease protein LptF